eukprot:6405177-Alexandrium_andersonii.AAC.1
MCIRDRVAQPVQEGGLRHQWPALAAQRGGGPEDELLGPVAREVERARSIRGTGRRRAPPSRARASG